MLQFRLIFMLFLTATALCATPTFAQTTQPSVAAETLELRAMTAFNQGQYAVALPLLEQLAERVKDDANRLGAVQEQIRVCQRGIEAASKAKPVDAQAAAGERPAPQTAENRKPHAPPKAGEIRQIAIKELGNFEYDPAKASGLPDDVKALNGSKVRLNGFMIPIDQADNISTFALVPSLFDCCFGQPPQIQHLVLVHSPQGKTVRYFPEELMVEGELKVEEVKDEDYVVSLFQLTASSVKPAAK
jgi:hypothetical protein